MSYWNYTDQEGIHTISEEQIIREYFPWWHGEMSRLGRFEQISPENCIEDWAIVHWAVRITAEQAAEKSLQIEKRGQ